MQRVVITGIGAICGNASNKDELFDACINGRSGIRKCTAFDATELITEYFGENENVSSENRLYDLIEKSCVEMMEDAKINPEMLSEKKSRCRLFYGTLLSNTESYFSHSKKKEQGQLESDDLAKMNDYAAYVTELLGIKGSVYISSAACASGTTAIGMAMDYIRNGICETAVVGGADPLTEIAAYGFHALKSLSKEICNPYDENRDGINIGECGAFFFLESLEHAQKRNADIYCELIGYGLGNDAYHITSPEPEGNGAYRTMVMALEDGKIRPDQLDYINGHGTGTVINDEMELKAIERLFENNDKRILVSSTKALIGHCMGSSGAIELASIIMSMKNNKYIPMPNLQSPIEKKNITMLSHTDDVNIEYALSNSFAFAGNSASILVKKYDGGKCE